MASVHGNEGQQERLYFLAPKSHVTKKGIMVENTKIDTGTAVSAKMKRRGNMKRMLVVMEITTAGMCTIGSEYEKGSYYQMVKFISGKWII